MSAAAARARGRLVLGSPRRSVDAAVGGLFERRSLVVSSCGAHATEAETPLHQVGLDLRYGDLPPGAPRVHAVVAATVAAVDGHVYPAPSFTGGHVRPAGRNRRSP